MNLGRSKNFTLVNLDLSHFLRRWILTQLFWKRGELMVNLDPTNFFERWTDVKTWGGEVQGGLWRLHKKYSKISTGVKNKILIQCRPKIFALFKNPKILTRKSRPSWVLGIKNMVLMKYPKISASAKPKISIRCKPNIFVVFKNPKILTSRTGNGFLVSKTWFLWNTPRFRQVLNLEFWYNVGPKSLPF